MVMFCLGVIGGAVCLVVTVRSIGLIFHSLNKGFDKIEDKMNKGEF